MTRWRWCLIPLALLCLALVAPLDLTSYGIPWAGLKRYGTYILTLWLVTAIGAMGINLILGYAGQESLAQAAFLGIGAYLTALTTKAGLPWGLAFLASGAVTFLVGIVLGFPALRVQKHYLAFVTLAFAVMVYLVFRNEQWLTGGVMGVSDTRGRRCSGYPTRHYLNFYWFVLAVTALLTAVMWWVIRSPWGRAFTALRENPIRAESLGIDVRLYTLLAFAIGSAYGGFAGALYAPLVEFIDPNPFCARPEFSLSADGGESRRRGLSSPAPSSARPSRCCCRNGCASPEGYYLLIYADPGDGAAVRSSPGGIVGPLYQQAVRPAAGAGRSPAPLPTARRQEETVQ